jgi:hypothetical protein
MPESERQYRKQKRDRNGAPGVLARSSTGLLRFDLERRRCNIA